MKKLSEEFFSIFPTVEKYIKNYTGADRYTYIVMAPAKIALKTTENQVKTRLLLSLWDLRGAN